MAEHFLISVDLDALNDKKLKTFSFLDRVHLRVTRDNVQRAASFLKEHFGHFATFCDVTAVTKTSDVVSLLDQGALKVVVSYRQAKAVLDALEDAGRLIVCIGDATSVTKEAKQELQALLAHAAVGIQANDVHGGEWLDAMQKRSKPPCSRYVALAPAPDIWDHYINAIKAGYVPIVPASSLTIDPTGQPHLLSVSRLLTGILHSDRPDGLFPTVVANEHGTCLGLVYSNEKSVETALKLGRGVYYSRSRNGIWIKGDESGDAQDLISIRCDCDADALRFIVRQEGDGAIRILLVMRPEMLTSCRVLPPQKLYMFWSVQWICTAGKNLAGSSGGVSCGLVYCSTLRRSDTTAGKNNGGSKRALRRIK